MLSDQLVCQWTVSLNYPGSPCKKGVLCPRVVRECCVDGGLVCRRRARVFCRRASYPFLYILP